MALDFEDAQAEYMRSHGAASLAAGTIGSVSARFAKVDDAFLKRLPAQVELAVRRAVFRLGQETRDRARAACPKRTGALAASIYVTSPGSTVAPSAANYKQRTAGYFRAITTASRKSKGRLVIEADKEYAHLRTQRRVGAANPPQQTGFRQGGFAPGEGDDFGYSFMPMAASDRSSFFVAVGVAAYYAGYVEFGTIRSAPKPFFTPAVKWAQQQVAARVTEAVRSATRGG